MSAPILIAGGGIGGLTAALCLARAGYDVEVFEQAHALTETGAGIQLSPNCSRVLLDLGLEEALSRLAFLPEGTQFRHWRDGRIVSESPLGADARARFGAPYYHVHRADLLETLAQAVARDDRIQVHLGARVETIETADEGVRIGFGGGAAEGSALVGADGIHSAVRAALWGADDADFTGNVAWRMLVPVERVPEGMVRPMSTVWWGPGKHFVHYYVRGGALVNCVCVVEKTGWQTESWTELGDPGELLEDFSGWHEDVVTLIEAAEPGQLFKWALFDRAPMARWRRGRVTLLGDACHPTLPFMAQGAAMAIEDAAVLARCLTRVADVETALERYEDLRRERTAGIQLGSRRNAKVFHLSGVPARLRDVAARRAGSKTMDRLYAYDPLSIEI